MPWYEPRYGPHSNYSIHFKGPEETIKKQTEPKSETNTEPLKKKAKTTKTSPASKSPAKKIVKKNIKKKKPRKTKSKVTPSSLF